MHKDIASTITNCGQTRDQNDVYLPRPLCPSFRKSMAKSFFKILDNPSFQVLVPLPHLIRIPDYKTLCASH